MLLLLLCDRVVFVGAVLLFLTYIRELFFFHQLTAFILLIFISHACSRFSRWELVEHVHSMKYYLSSSNGVHNNNNGTTMTHTIRSRLYNIQRFCANPRWVPPKRERAHHMHHVIPRTHDSVCQRKERTRRQKRRIMRPLSKILINFFSPIYVPSLWNLYTSPIGWLCVVVSFYTI